ASSSSSPKEDNRVFVVETAEPLPEECRIPGQPSRAGGIAQLSWINHATDLAARGRVAALVTGPVSKEVIAHSGAPGSEGFAGHTEHIANRVGAKSPVMVFVADCFAVSLATTHVAVRNIASDLTIQRVFQATTETVRLLARLGLKRPRVAVAALNPHAGEGGLLGEEETTIIAPAIAQAKTWATSRQHDSVIDGPIPAEGAFRNAFDGAYDGVVAMYHDQGTIPMKTQFFGRAVNVTAGLPIVRTSVDHGTAYDIAGQGKADAGSMIEAIRLAFRLSRQD
ncbi:MAG: 4-hydroxythreonine-4-phosphate dehydrogenase PdxA, partial [Polyangiaceae bacterium]|nr:4-hydroxythreonine-4-phosphate dehydrogenase PdxA [Polyangiaceae bacterium]